MRQKHSRRKFLGVGIGCAAPLVLGGPLVRAARGALAPGGPAATDDPILEQLRVEAFRNYRRARAWAGQTGTMPADNLRTAAQQVGLLEGYVAGRGDDQRIERALKEHVQREGIEAAVLGFTDTYRALSDRLAAEEGVTLPAEPDLARAEKAAEILQRRGVRRATRVLRQWLANEAARVEAERAGTALPVRQKPGDDFLGPDEYREIRLSCDDVAIMIDIIWLVVAVATVAGLGTVAEIYGVVAAACALIRAMACAQPKV